MGLAALGLAGAPGAAVASSSTGSPHLGTTTSAHAARARAKKHRSKPKPKAFIEGLHGTLKTVASTIPANGDVNPYALLVAPVSAGKIVKGDLLVDNFNDKGNDQGTGSTIVQVTPQGKVSLFTEISRTHDRMEVSG